MIKNFDQRISAIQPGRTPIVRTRRVAMHCNFTSYTQSPCPSRTVSRPRTAPEEVQTTSCCPDTFSCTNGLRKIVLRLCVRPGQLHSVRYASDSSNDEIWNVPLLVSVGRACGAYRSGETSDDKLLRSHQPMLRKNVSICTGHALLRELGWSYIAI